MSPSARRPRWRLETMFLILSLRLRLAVKNAFGLGKTSGLLQDGCHSMLIVERRSCEVEFNAAVDTQQ